MSAPRASFLPLHALAACALVASLAVPATAAPSPAPAKKPSPAPASHSSAAAPVELVEELEGGARINWSAGRMSVSGVSTDEELISVIQHQHSYQAAARLVSVVDEMTQTLIDLGR